MRFRSSIAAALLAAVTGFFATARAADPPGEGALLYAQRCANCHGQAMEGAAGPALKGPSFQYYWAGRFSEALYLTIQRKMPPEAPGELPAAQYRAIFNHILAQNGWVEGASALMAAGPPPPKLDVPPLPAAPVEPARAPSTQAPAQSLLTRQADGDWLHYNRDYQGQRFSPLKEITPRNAGRLAPRCVFQAGEVGSFQTSPLAWDGKLYLTTPRNTYAIDAATCRKLWAHEHFARGPEGGVVNRGPALAEGRLFRGTPDGHLLALDAATGALLWDAWVCDASQGCNISAAPVVFDGKVVVGEGGADRGHTSHIHAFDAATGRELWTFHPVPRKGEPGSETWSEGQHLGGGSSWSTISVDPATGYFYAPIGNPGSDIDGAKRSGANLFTNSVVVLDGATGKLVSYAQQVPHDLWDWDTASAPTLYRLDGKSYMAVPSKAGWLFLYEGDEHKLVARRQTTRHKNIDVPPTEDGVHVCPGTLGGSEWNGAAFDPKQRLLVLGTADWCTTLTKLPALQNSFGGVLQMDPAKDAIGWLRAFDAKTGEPRWSWQADVPMLAGVTATAGGVLFTGTMNGDFLAFDTKLGKELYRFNTGGAIAGGIISYQAGGKQLVAVTSGNASRTIWETKGAATVLVFGLP